MNSLLLLQGPGLVHLLLLLPLPFAKPRLRWQLASLTLPLYLLATGLWFSIGPEAGPSSWFALSQLGMTMLLLICLIGFVVLRHACSNLQNDPDERRFLGWFLGTLGAVSVTVTANQLPLLVLGWLAISLCLHQLLLFYPERPRAALATHKKFIFARSSELLLALACLLLYLQHGTLEIRAILASYTDDAIPGAREQWAAVLLALVALIKCAQLPFHGWLIQVVEAPTPVSALLHAGIVNLGGFLLLLFGPLLSLATPAQWLLLLVAGPGCVLAALVMSTRISIKVRLAWSTVAQMGLMLLECALGLYELALLHLLAHSCYKALAFLGAGEACTQHLRRIFTQQAAPRLPHWLWGTALAITLQTGAHALGLATHSLAFGLLLTVGLATLLAHSTALPSLTQALTGHLLAAGGTLAYLLLVLLGARFAPAAGHAPSVLQDIWAAALFLVLFALFQCLQHAPQRAWVRQLFITLNAGCYLDEWATRLTLTLWPLRRTA